MQQPALVTTSLAMLAALKARGIKPDVVIGHSVGEFSALAAVQAMPVHEAIALVRERGLAMAEAAQEDARLDGCDPRARRRGRRGGSASGSSTSGPRTTTAPARSSSPARTPPSTRPASRREEEGARKTVKLKVSGAFHSPLVARAAERLRPALERVRFKNPIAPFMSTVTAQVEPAQRLADLLVDQLTAPVRFTQAATRADPRGRPRRSSRSGPATC